MKQWEIWTFDFADAGPHPAVIISHPDRVARAPAVNVLLCASQRATRAPHLNEFLLNSADGLDWQTLVKCDLSYLVEKALLYGQRGAVASTRRHALAQRIIACFALNLV